MILITVINRSIVKETYLKLNNDNKYHLMRGLIVFYERRTEEV